VRSPTKTDGRLDRKACLAIIVCTLAAAQEDWVVMCTDMSVFLVAQGASVAQMGTPENTLLF
jgi:hypothetical protein